MLGMYVHHPVTACCAGHAPVASDVSATAVVEGKGVSSRRSRCVRRNGARSSLSRCSAPSPSITTSTRCSASPIAAASARRRA